MYSIVCCLSPKSYFLIRPVRQNTRRYVLSSNSGKKGWKRRTTLWNWLITKTRLCIQVIDVQFHILVVLSSHCFVLLLCDLCSMHCNGFYTLAYLWCEVMGRISKQNQAPNIFRSNVLNEKFKIQFFSFKDSSEKMGQ